jgi:hypothetical protein
MDVAFEISIWPLVLVAIAVIGLALFVNRR